MFNKNRFILPGCLLSVALLHGQPPAAAPAKPDSDAVKALIEKAKKTGGPEWAGEAATFTPGCLKTRRVGPVFGGRDSTTTRNGTAL